MSQMKRFLTRRNVLIVLALLFFLIAWNREVNLLYGMFALVSATVIVAVILPRFALKGVEAARVLPAAAFEGEEIEVRITLENRERRSRFMVEAIDAIPAAAPHEREPLVFAARLPGRTRRDFAYRLACYKRGHYTVGPLRLRSAYPLGIAWSERQGDQSNLSLLVYPSMFEVASFPLLAAGTYVSSGMETMERANGSDDFFGTREYRQGDSLRHIHWPSTARHDRLIVKEFEVRASTEMTLILDLHQGSDAGGERESTLEYAVRIAASLARFALERGHTVQLTAYGRESAVVPPGRGQHHLPQVLDTLARVTADGPFPYHETITRAATFLRDGSTAVLFLSGNGNLDDFLHPLGLLQAKRIRPVVISFNRASFTGEVDFGNTAHDAVAGELLAQGAPVYLVAKGDDLSEVFV
ncbi:MAG TPA: DUF58 domain-containing protein [Geobacteraceae bacterium]